MTIPIYLIGTITVSVTKKKFSIKVHRTIINISLITYPKAFNENYYTSN